MPKASSTMSPTPLSRHSPVSCWQRSRADRSRLIEPRARMSPIRPAAGPLHVFPAWLCCTAHYVASHHRRSRPVRHGISAALIAALALWTAAATTQEPTKEPKQPHPAADAPGVGGFGQVAGLERCLES